MNRETEVYKLGMSYSGTVEGRTTFCKKCKKQILADSFMKDGFVYMMKEFSEQFGKSVVDDQFYHKNCLEKESLPMILGMRVLNAELREKRWR